MSKTEQGVLDQGKRLHPLLHLLLLLILALPSGAFADTTPSDIAVAATDEPVVFHLALMYSPESILQTEIAEILSSNLKRDQSNIHISIIRGSGSSQAGEISPDLIVAIGQNNVQNAAAHFSKTDKLLIASAPVDYSHDESNGRHDTVLYMTQPYCRQIQLIRLINDQWHSISYFSQQKRPVDDLQLKQCAIKYKFELYQANITDTDKLTNPIKNALKNSDLILALPDKDIFNSKTVKNILLTSYRYRKPVIAFSESFVNAGALASIHSDTEQIAKSASDLIEQYFASDRKFIHSVNYPKSFEIDINRQVFRALNLNIPDMDNIKQVIESTDMKTVR